MQLITLSKQSLKQPPVVTEMYIPLWCADGIYSSSQFPAISFGSQFLTNGTLNASTLTVATYMFTLNSQQLNSIKYAFEASIYGNIYGGYLALWDVTTNSIVSSSQIFQNSTSGVITVRSGQFLLTPEHTYAITGWSGNASYPSGVVDVSLIIFGSQ